MTYFYTLFLTALFATSVAQGNTVIHFKNGDQCILASEIPLMGADYKKKDAKKMKNLCSLDLAGTTYQYTQGFENVALCPKLFSTSPAVEVFRISNDLTREIFEREGCSTRVGEKTKGKKLAKYKVSIGNTRTSSIISYFHISRALDIGSVPVTVLRTLNKDVHETIAVKGVQYSSRNPGEIISRLWASLLNWIKNGNTKVMLASGEQSFGALSVNPRGEQKYYEDFWPGSSGSKGIDRFKNEKVYRNLGIQRPLTDFIGRELTDANYQKLLKMIDASGMIILDSIFGQSDRFGNVHSEHVFLIVNDKGESYDLELDDVEEMIEKEGTEKEKAEFAKADEMPKDWMRETLRRNKKIVEIAKSYLTRKGLKHAHAQEMLLKDNDAGLGSGNPFNKRKMIDGVYHVNQKTYEQVVALYNSVKSGALETYLQETLLLKGRELDRFKEGLYYVAEDLIDKDQRGRLFKDLVKPEDYFAPELKL